MTGLKSHQYEVFVSYADEDRGWVQAICWSLLDNFEWAHGSRSTFGLVAVDRTTQLRTSRRARPGRARSPVRTGSLSVAVSPAVACPTRTQVGRPGAHGRPAWMAAFQELTACRKRPTNQDADAGRGDAMRTAGPGQLGPDRQGRAGRIWHLLPILALVMVAGCARPDAQTRSADATTTSPSPAIVTVGPNDAGRTVHLKVGDRLVVELHAAKQPSRFPPAWTVGSLPPKVLKRIPGDSTPTRVVFVAEAPGMVRLVLAQRLGCAPPLRCPLAPGPFGQSERMHPPLPAVVITIRVQ
jgi:Glycosyl hydrolase family 1